MDLDPDAEAILLKAARSIPDAHRQSFFDLVADRLRRLRYIALTDVRHACAIGVQKFGGVGFDRGGVKQKRAGYG
jgi:hypothetical protein